MTLYEVQITRPTIDCNRVYKALVQGSDLDSVTSWAQQNRWSITSTPVKVKSVETLIRETL